jgi:hypothetical protein
LTAAEEISESTRPPRGRAPSLLALLGVTLVLMGTPAFVAAISILDSQLLDRTVSWFPNTGGLGSYLTLGRWALALALAGGLSTAREDQ